MRSAFLLAWRYLAYHRSRTVLLVVALSLTCVLPLSAHLLIRAFSTRLIARAQDTPRIVGARGDRFNLVLRALYFRTVESGAVNHADVIAIRDGGLAAAIPLHLRYTAHRHPLVGTTLDYFDMRGLRIADGTPPLRLGDAVLGASTAATLRLRPGDALLTDQQSLYNIAATYPLKLHVTGVLAPTGTADDDAVFVDIQTAWIVDGYCHGHTDVTTPGADPAVILSRTQREVKTNAAIVEYHEITDANIGSFHVHGADADLPVSAIIVLPHDEKSATLLQARYNQSETRQMLAPEQVVRELTDLVLRVQKFFDANFALVATAAALFLAIILMLSRQLRRRELETMWRIGCRPGMAARIQAAELAIVLLLSLILSSGIAVAALRLAPRWERFI